MIKLPMQVLFVSWLLATTAIIADDKADLDAAPLENLGSDLLSPATGATAMRPEGKFGEDLAAKQPSRDIRIERVVQHMQTAQELLRQPSSVARASSSQAEALLGLDSLITELSERKSQSSDGKREKAVAPQSAKKPGSSAGAGTSPTESASIQSRGEGDLAADLAATGQLAQDLWGELPERQRQQILQPLSEEFLPKYASEIEAYYRALADPQPPAPDSQ